MAATPLTVEIVVREDRPVLCLRGALGVTDASGLREAAMKLVAECALAASRGQTDRGAGLDLSALESGDISILQVLVALEAEFGRLHWLLQVQEPPAAVAGQWRSAGWRGFSATRDGA